MVGVRRVLYKIGPPGSKFRVIDFAILQPKLEVGIDGDELCI